GTHNMDNSLLARGRAEIAYAEFRCVHCERFELLPALLVSDWYGIARFVQPRRGWQVVIRHRQRQFGPAYLAPVHPQCLESLRAGHFMDQVAVDKDQAGAVVALFDDMRIPDLLIQCAGLAGHDWPIRPSPAQIKQGVSLGG